MPSARPLHVTITLLSAGVLISLLFALFNPLSNQNQLQQFRYAGESAGRMMDRHMEFYAGYEHVPAAEKELHTFLFGSRETVEADVIANYRSVMRFFEQYPEVATPWSQMNTRSRLMVTLAETGRIDELQLMLAEASMTPEQDVINDAFNYAYLNQRDIPVPSVMSGARMMPLGWSADRLWLRIAQNNQDKQVEKYVLHRHLENGERLRDRVWYLSWTVAIIILSGLFLFIKRRQLIFHFQWPDGVLINPWSFYSGISVAVRAALLGLLIVIGLQILASQYFRPGILALWSTLFASLPMLWMLKKKLLGVMTIRQAFGLSLCNVGLKKFFCITTVFLALEWLGMMAISWIAWKAGIAENWTEGINERMFFGPTETVVLSAVNIIVWAPVLEEIGFRGLLYTTLRSRYGVVSSILFSAFVFSALHMYSFTGFLSVFWSGVILAFVYEKYRSLLPGMMIHGVGNLLSLSMVVLFYR